MLIVILVVVAVVVLAVAWISLSNGIVRAANKCDNAWQTIDTQLPVSYTHLTLPTN